MPHKKYPHLFTPMTVKNITFKNRVLASPVTANRIIDHGYPTPEGIDTIETRARGGFAQITFTESFVDNEFASRHEHGLNVYEKHMSTYHMEAVMTLTEAIKAHGAVASIQLNHVGGVNHPDACQGRNPIGPSAFVREDGVQVDEMDADMMRQAAGNYAEAAWNCKALGFDMIMIHGGHGWLLSQFISPLSNRRRDEYGGSLENRAKFPIMVLKKIREVCGEDFPIEYRVSGAERVPGGMEIAETAAFCRLIEPYVDMIHVTSGIYHSHVETKAFSSMFDPHGCNLDLAEAVRKAVSVPVVAVGGFNAPEQIEAALSAGKCDFVALGRQQFADPEFVNKALTGRDDEIASCLRCSCFNPLMVDPDSRPIPSLWHCTVNPLAGRELRWRNAPVPKGKRRVLVIGGGVGGMYAAITAAERGHQVTLAEKEKKLGGLLWFTDYDEHKESLRRFRDSLIVRCAGAGVDVRLETAVDTAFVEDLEPDAVICCIGSVPAVPPIKGIGLAHHALHSYSSPESLGEKIVMIGGGLIGCETAYWLQEKGHQVRVLEMRDGLAIDGNDSHRRALLPRMKNAGVTCQCGVQVTEVTATGVKYFEDGEEGFAEADTVLYAVGQKARSKEAEALRESSSWFVNAGDSLRPRLVKQAVYEGFCAAMDVL